MSDIAFELELDVSSAVSDAGKATAAFSKTEDAGDKLKRQMDALGATFAKIAHDQIAAATAAVERLRAGLPNVGSGFANLGNQFAFAGHKADQMEDAFSSLAREMKKDEATAKALGAALAGGTTKGFASMADAIKSEYEMLKSIHGDMVAYQRDVQVLDAMQKKGLITQKEYAAAKSQARSNAGIANPMSAVSLPGIPKAAATGGGGMLGGLGELATTAGLAAGAIAIGKEVIGSWMEYDQAQNAAFNTLRKYAPDVDSTNTILDQQAAAASALGESLENTVGAFSAVREATSSLYLTSRQQTDITRTLGETMKLNGKPISEVSGLMERLQADMELGTMGAGEFKTILRQFPDVVDMWADKMGKSSKQLQEMARNGKLGAAEMKKLFSALQDGSEVHAKFADRQQSTTDKIKDFLDPMKDVAKRVAEEGEALAKSGDLTLDKAEAYKELANKAHEATPILDALLKKLRDEADAWPQLILFHVDAANSIEKINNAMQGQIALTRTLAGIAVTKNAVTDPILLMNQLSGAGATQAIEKQRKILADYRDVIEQTKSLSDFEKNVQLGEIDRAMENLTGGRVADAAKKTFEDLHKGWADFGGFAGLQAKTVVDDIEKMRLEWEQWQNDLETSAGFEHLDTSKMFGGLKGTDKDKQIGDEINSGQDMEKFYADAAKGIEDYKKLVGSLGDVFKDQVVSSAKTLGDILVDGAKDGDVSWSQWSENAIDAIEKAIMQALILKALTGSMSGGTGPDGKAVGGLFGLLGFSTGGDATMTSSGLQRRYPGAATGADWLVPGTGSTDSVVVPIKVSPSESIHVRTGAGREAMAQGGGGGSTTVNNIIQHDPRALLPALGTPEGHRQQMNFIRTNLPAVKSLLGIR